MAKESKRRCPDCEIDISGLFFSSKGDGRCIECKGTRRDRHSEALVQAATLGLEGNYYPCKICAGTGQCQTCGGTGYEYYDDDISYHSESSSSAGSGSSDFLAKLIGFLIVAAIVIWFVVAVAIPLIIINIAIISLIVGLAQKKFRIILFPFSILGAIYIVIDYNKGFFTKTLANNVSFLSGLIPIFFYANIIAGLIAAYFLIRDLLNKNNPPVENEGEFSKRNLITMGSLLLTGCLTIGLQEYFGSRNSQEVQSTIIESSSGYSTTAYSDEQNIRGKVDEYLQRNMQSSVDYVTSLYAENIDFYNSGIVDKNFIRKDKRNYFSKWPERNITLSSAVDVIAGSEKNTWVASFNFYFQVRNTKRSVQGEAWCRLIFKLYDNSLVIISEKGGVYNNK